MGWMWGRGRDDPKGGGKDRSHPMTTHPHMQVLLDGRPVRAYQHEWYHRHVSIVAQEPVLYGRSIRRNIIFGLEVGPSVRIYVWTRVCLCARRGSFPNNHNTTTTNNNNTTTGHAGRAGGGGDPAGRGAGQRARLHRRLAGGVRDGVRGAGRLALGRAEAAHRDRARARPPPARAAAGRGDERAGRRVGELGAAGHRPEYVRVGRACGSMGVGVG